MCVCRVMRVCFFSVCVCVSATDVQHDMSCPVVVQRIQGVDLRYVHGDDQESRPHFVVATCFDKYPTAQEITSLDFGGLQRNKVAFYVATYADLRGIFL